MRRAREMVSQQLLARRPAAVQRKLVWILGSPRSGSTWLMYLLEETPRVAVLQEPLIGMHLGLFASYLVESGQGTLPAGVRMRDLRDDDRYFFSDRYARDWEPALRRLILSRLTRHLSLRSQRLVVQEPNGSEGADLLMRVLPQSRLLFLVRDGRDVVDSVIDAYRPGAWLDEAFGVGQSVTGPARAHLMEREAQRWAARTEIVWRAYTQHSPARRLLVRYEDLLADTSKELRTIYSWLGLPTPTDLQVRVDRHAFSSLPDAAKGSGKFHRAATPGMWRQSFSLDEQECCERIMGPMLRTLGYQLGTEAPE